MSGKLRKNPYYSYYNLRLINKFIQIILIIAIHHIRPQNSYVDHHLGVLVVLLYLFLLFFVPVFGGLHVGLVHGVFVWSITQEYFRLSGVDFEVYFF
jgi:hypothetical protein